MKLLLLLFLVGFVSARPGDGLDRTLEGQVKDLLGDPAFLTVYRGDDKDIQTEFGKKLRDALDDVLEKVKDAIEQGKVIREDVLAKLKEIREKMKEMKIEAGEKAKELLKKIQDRAKDFLKKILERLGLKNDKDAVLRGSIFEDEVDTLIYNAEEDDEIKTELGKKLRDALDQIMEKVKESIEQGKTVKQDVLDKLKDLKEKMKELKIDMGEKARELYEKIKEKAKDYLRELLDKLGLKASSSDVAHSVSLKKLFKKLKKELKETIDKEKLKEKIEKFFGKGTELAESLINMLKEKGEAGKQKLLELVDKILGDDEDRETRSLKDIWERVKDYFNKLNIELKEKYLKFGEWVKEKVKKGIDTSKTKMENIKTIAKEFVENTKTVSKDVAVEALEFLRPYKDDLGGLWDQVKDSVKEVLGRND